MGRVFLLNLSGHDIRELKKFSGTIIPLSEGNVNIFDLDRLKYNFLERLKNNAYHPAQDFIALTGNLILGFVLGQVVASNYAGRINVLLWDAKKCDYKLREFTASKMKIKANIKEIKI